MATHAALSLALAAATLLASCGGGSDPAEPAQNDAVRLREQIEKQADQISKQTEEGTGAIEQALENEGAIIFENRENLLNQAATNAALDQTNAAQPEE